MNDKPRESVEKAFAIAGALQRKFVGQFISIQRTPLKPDGARLLFEYTLSEGGNKVVATCYSEGFFDSDSITVSYLATRIYRELKERWEWKALAH